MKKIISVFLIALMLITFSACSNNDTKEDNWGSFTSEKAFSYDDKYYATQTVEKISDVSYINVSVYLTENDEFVYSFTPARTMDFWGICWENNSYNIWIQSADTGTHCYKYGEDSWALDESLTLPDYIKTKYD